MKLNRCNPDLGYLLVNLLITFRAQRIDILRHNVLTKVLIMVVHIVGNAQGTAVNTGLTGLQSI